MVMWETPRYIGVYNDQNKYGYWLNLNHPDVLADYKAYCAKIGHPERYPLSDRQRRIFEIWYIRRHGIGPDMPEWVRYQYHDDTRAGRAPGAER